MQGLALKLPGPLIRYHGSGCFTLASSLVSRRNLPEYVIQLSYSAIST
jgi:hypothetical protein